MKIIKRLLKKLLYDVSSKLRPYEEDCLMHWQLLLEDNAKVILSKQLNYYDLISRQSKDKLVLFCNSGDIRCNSMPEEDLFPLRTEDEIACRMELSLPNKKNVKYIVEISIHKGRLFSIEFDHPPVIHGDEYHIADVNILSNVLADSRTENLQTSDLLFNDYFDKIDFNCNCLPNNAYNSTLNKINVTVPPDYLAFVNQTSKFKFSDCEVYPPDKIKKIVRPEANYYLLATIYEEGDIAILQYGNEPKVLYLDNEKDEAEILGGSFISAIKSQLNKKTI